MRRRTFSLKNPLKSVTNIWKHAGKISANFGEKTFVEFNRYISPWVNIKLKTGDKVM